MNWDEDFLYELVSCSPIAAAMAEDRIELMIRDLRMVLDDRVVPMLAAKDAEIERLHGRLAAALQSAAEPHQARDFVAECNSLLAAKDAEIERLKEECRRLRKACGPAEWIESDYVELSPVELRRAVLELWDTRAIGCVPSDGVIKLVRLCRQIDDMECG